VEPVHVSQNLKSAAQTNRAVPGVIWNLGQPFEQSGSQEGEVFAQYAVLHPLKLRRRWQRLYHRAPTAPRVRHAHAMYCAARGVMDHIEQEAAGECRGKERKQS